MTALTPVALDITQLGFAGGTVDASRWQLEKGPTSHAVPMCIDAIDVSLHNALIFASHFATLVDREENLYENEIPCASGQPWYEATWREWTEARAELAGYEDDFREGAAHMVWVRWLARRDAEEQGR